MKRIPVLLYLFLLLTFSCTPQKKIVYFQGNAPSDNVQTEPFELTISPNDILAINIYTVNPEAIPFLATDKPTADNRSPYERGYVVDNNGLVEISLIGTIKLSGLTLPQAEDSIQSKLKLYIDDPIVTVKKLSFRITLLGEVNKPGVYTIQQEKITLTEVLGLAGDLTNFGNRTNVKIIRKSGKQPQIMMIDLTSSKALSPESSYMYPDDIVYIEPVKRKAILNVSPAVSVITSLITSSIVVLSFILTQSK